MDCINWHVYLVFEFIRYTRKPTVKATFKFLMFVLSAAKRHPKPTASNTITTSVVHLLLAPIRPTISLKYDKFATFI